MLKTSSLCASLPLECRTARPTPTPRRHEPVTQGVPFPRGWCAEGAHLSLFTDGDRAVPLQTTVVDRWSDGSIRWALLDFQADSHPAHPSNYDLRRLDAPSGVAHSSPVRVSIASGGARIDTGAVKFAVRPDGTLAAHSGHDGSLAAIEVVGGVSVTSDAGVALAAGPIQLALEHDGPLRSVVLATTALRLRGSERRLDLFVRYHFFAGSPVVRLQVTVRNPHRAQHSGGYWELGDPGSWLLKDVSFVATLEEPASRVSCSLEHGREWREFIGPLAVYQESSGGDRWDSAAHVNRNGDVPMRHRGYTLAAGPVQETGLRATPIVEAQGGCAAVAVAHRQFWQRFPKAITVEERTVRIGLLPSEFPDVHEVQGGEQFTEEFALCIGADPVGEHSLEWVREPLRVRLTPEWYCDAEAMPHLVPVSADPRPDYLALVNAAIDGAESFAAKREIVDEYGWRHFGDLYADHETVHHSGDELFVSHYNNQYDAAAGLAIHFFRSADPAALTLFEDLVRHVIDVDIYHTIEDKPAYNHGLFWHTAHHTNAGRATHRTYPQSGGASGGPSAEHNYTTGLMLYFFMTGDLRARETVIGLAQWVLDMDDGNLTPLRWLSRAPTGLASATGSFDYHGPGRGPGNGIVTLLNAYRLTGDGRFMSKAEALIQRCVHPVQDLEALNLFDTERRWYYTVFLQALGRYLEVKEELGEVDERHAYARAALLHYARWMAEHEYPYLERPEKLEFPTETWAAQDMRKREVFVYAAAFAANESERARFLARAGQFFASSVSSLSTFPTRTFTRPEVLMLTNGYSLPDTGRREPDSEPEPADSYPVDNRSFVPQKRDAIRRGIVVGVAGGLLWLAALSVFLL